MTTTRPIKFRAWDKKTSRMRIVKSIMSEEGGPADFVAYRFNPDGDNEPFWETDFVLMQFTGLLDSKGREIYENDFVKHENGQISVVEWSDGDWGWWMKSVKNWSPKTQFDSSTDEIIGNIYENPELLK